MTRYSWFVKTDDHRTRHLIQPHGKLEIRRDSKAALKSCTDEFHRLMWNHPPAGPDAKAWLERTDSRGYTTTLETFTPERNSPHPSWKSPTAGGFATKVIICGAPEIVVDRGPTAE